MSRVRSPLGRRGIYAVRIGVDNRADANIICQQLRGAGGACIVVQEPVRQVIKFGRRA